PEDDEQDHVERLERRELPTPEHPHQQVDEEEQEGGSNGDVHYGKMVRWRLKVRSEVLPSFSSTVCSRLKVTFVGLTWNCMKRMWLSPAAISPSSKERRPLSLVSLSGLGSIVFICIPSAQPGPRTRVAFLMSSRAVMWKRAS